MDAVVVGGGIAGLVAANRFADLGWTATLLERHPELGGRARTDEDRGFRLNVGPHALYNCGALSRSLRSLGVPVSGGQPDLRRGVVLRDGTVHPLPAGPISMLRSRLFGGKAKLQLARFLARPRPPDSEGLSAAAWVDGTLKDPAAADLARALIRLTCYTANLSELSADAAGAQLALSLKGVRYLDGGWASIVAGLEARARKVGVRVERCQVKEIGRDGRRWCVAGDDREYDADAVVVAVAGPRAAYTLIGRARASVFEVPSDVAVLDVGLSGLPDPDRAFALSLDSPHYVSVHSPPARLSDGGVLVSAIDYLSDQDPAHDARARLEELMDRFQPGWRERVLMTRYLPRIAVTRSLPTVATGGLPGRQPVASAERPGLYLAGDWVGPTGLLADAAAASAEAAVQMAAGQSDRLR